MLSTDGRSSFATIIYNDSISLDQINREFQTGFSAGDRRRFYNIPPNSNNSSNSFRIDGKSLLVIQVYTMQDSDHHAMAEEKRVIDS